MKQARCNTCGAELRWAKTSNDGSIPLNAKPDPLGPLVLDEHGRIGPRDGEAGTPDLRTRYTRHTCPER